MTTDLLRHLEGEVYFVEGEGNGKFPSCHGILITGKETVLIDAGMGKERIEEIDRDKRIDVLIFSHTHLDHIRYWCLLKDRHILFPQETPDLVTDLESLGKRFMGTDEMASYWVQGPARLFGIHAMREPDGRYSDGDVLDFGGAKLQAIHTPGHLKDHYCFLEQNTGTLLSTDIDLTSFGPWYGNPECNINAFEQDVKKVMDLPYKRVCSSHREPIEGDATDQFEAYLQVLDQHRQMVLNLCDPPHSLEEMVETSPFYSNKLWDRAIQQTMERTMIRKNLELLIRDGLVQESDGKYRLII